MKEITITSTAHQEVIDITDETNAAIKSIGLQNGSVSLFLLHTTAGLTTTTLDPKIDLDILNLISVIFPHRFHHPRTIHNLPLYIVASFFGPSLVIPMKSGELCLGTMQRIILLELNGPRERLIRITGHTEFSV